MSSIEMLTQTNILFFCCYLFQFGIKSRFSPHSLTINTLPTPHTAHLYRIQHTYCRWELIGITLRRVRDHRQAGCRYRFRSASGAWSQPTSCWRWTDSASCPRRCRTKT